jgi:hypothetical protein
MDSATGNVMVAKKVFRDHTVWLSTYLFRQPQVFRTIFKAAGAHLYGTENDVFHEGGGLLMVHTKKGGAKTIRLRNGKEVVVTMAPESTVYLDSETGAVLLQ